MCYGLAVVTSLVHRLMQLFIFSFHSNSWVPGLPSLLHWAEMSKQEGQEENNTFLFHPGFSETFSPLVWLGAFANKMRLREMKGLFCLGSHSKDVVGFKFMPGSQCPVFISYQSSAPFMGPLSEALEDHGDLPQFQLELGGEGA